MIQQEQVTKLLKDVISINSMNPSLTDEGTDETELAEYIGDYLSDLGLDVSFQETEGRKNVIAILKGTGGGKTLILNAHTDTVGREGMVEPLQPYVEDGKVFGRGAYDMKGGMVSCLLAINAIVTAGIELKGDLIFAGVIDEEYGSLGTEMLVRDYAADAAIICEPTDARVVIANKGFSWIKITVFGKASHGSKPHLGIDAIDHARKVMNELASLQEELDKKPHPLVGAPKVRVSKIEGGLGLSTIADECTLYIERRTLPPVQQKDVQQELDQIIDKLSKEDDEFSAEFEFIIFRAGLELSEDEQIVKVITSNFRKITGREAELSGEPWWMDSSLMAEHGIPTVVLGPEGEGAHAKVEYVNIDSVIEIAEIIRSTSIEFCS